MSGSGHEPSALAARRIRLLYFHHAHDPGGAVRSLAALVAGLDKQQIEPIVAIPDRPGADEVRALLEKAGATVIAERHIRPFHGSTVVPVSTLREKIYSLAGLFPLALLARKLVKQLNPDVVHLNSTSVVGAAIGTRLSGARKPVIAHVREPLLPNRWGRWLASLNRKFVDHFISIDAEGIRSLGQPSPAGSVIFNFVDTDVFRPDAARRATERSARGWGDDDVVFLSLSRITAANGALELVRSIGDRDDRIDKRARFAIAGFEGGGGAYQQQVQEAVDRSSRCDAIGFTHDVRGLIDAADVIVAPFTTPHSARSVFEGAAMGRPALVTKLPNLQELIVEGETGLAYDRFDPDELIDAVNRLCRPDERRSFSDAAFRFAGEQFAARTNVARTVAVYHRLMATAGGNGASEKVAVHP
jgi:glycosyltransferase involved in cell wall biosynthesis